MGNAVSLRVEINPTTNDGPFSAGQVVSGKVHVEVKKPMPKNKPVTVTILAEEMAEVLRPPVKQTGSTYITKANLVLYQQHYVLPFPPSVMGDTVEPGTYSLDFTGQIPAGAPPTTGWDGRTFADTAGRVRHVVRAAIIEPQQTSNDAELQVITPLPRADAAVPAQVLRPFKAGRGNISVGFCVDDSQVCPGGRLQLRAVCRNRSNIPIKQVNVQLMEHKMWQTKTPGAPSRRGLLTCVYLSDHHDKVVSDHKNLQVPGLVFDKMSGSQLKTVKELERKNHSFVMEPDVLADITSSLKDLRSTGVSQDIPSDVNCSYKGTLVQFSHFLKVTIVAGRFKGVVTDYQTPLVIGRFPKKN